MSNELSVEGMSIAPGVVETIISIAANEVDGVASVGSFATSSIRSMLAAKPSAAGIEVVVDDVRVDELAGINCDAARTGEVGDGKIFVFPVDEVIRIRTGERGDAAV